MPTKVIREDGQQDITLHDIETLTGWPELAGFVVVAIGKTPGLDGLLRVHMLADTSDSRQIVALLARVAAQVKPGRRVSRVRPWSLDLQKVTISAWPDGRMAVRHGDHVVSEPRMVRRVLAAIVAVASQEQRGKRGRNAGRTACAAPPGRA